MITKLQYYAFLKSMNLQYNAQTRKYILPLILGLKIVALSNRPGGSVYPICDLRKIKGMQVMTHPCNKLKNK